MCVLDWCKLFGDRKAKHYWSKVVSTPEDFKAGLLHHLGLDETVFEKEVLVVRHYRDKFLAHLDSENEMDIPRLEIAKAAIWFYHSHIVEHEAKEDDLQNLPIDLTVGYELCEMEARAVFQAAVKTYSAQDTSTSRTDL
jgi:hypothetical protein